MGTEKHNKWFGVTDNRDIDRGILVYICIYLSICLSIYLSIATSSRCATHSEGREDIDGHCKTPERVKDQPETWIDAYITTSISISISIHLSVYSIDGHWA